MMVRRTHSKGQALVEFALAATLIFFLLAAAVDVGLIFFALQGLHNAAQEGASYGSRWGVDFNTTAGGAVVFDKNAIIDHIRGESGPEGGNGFINLYDLDGNGVDDRIEHGTGGYNEPNISIDILADPSLDGDPTVNVATGATENTLCTDPTVVSTPCYIRVTVKSVHKMLFAFAPAFARTVPLHSTFVMPLRSSLARGTGTGTSTQVKICVVPNFKGILKKNAQTLWSNNGWTSTVSFSGSFPSQNTPINIQDKTANSTDDCSKTITLKP